ncbi:hypothetical protein RBE51_30080 [Pseudomonas taiwanensis]|uniref:hypothetical protein n=1 Tax=Pseudomonas taiwanensis TaxID=470150 RepID=UPI0028DDF949|nr:hypothetical protein [Pseudomonas taiwanensis]MDT8927046.1 hypothetical protein [Pseudomonas taiwanensis]
MAGIYAEYCKKYALSVDVNSSALAELFRRHVLLDKHELKLLYQEVYSGIPDTEDYSDELVDQARCAVICTSYCVEYLENSSHESVRYAIAKVAEAIDILDEDVDRKTALEVDWCDQLLDVLIERDLGDVQKIKDIRQKNLLHEVPVLGV